MSQNVVLRDWLDDDFLSEPFASGGRAEIDGMQVQLVIADQPAPRGMQGHLQVLDFAGARGMQAEFILADATEEIGSQVELGIAAAERVLGTQALLQVLDFVQAVGQQVEAQVGDKLAAFGMQLATSNILYQLIGGWLEDDWLTTDWLGRQIKARAGMQVHAQVLDFEAVPGMQVEGQIADQLAAVAMQAELHVIDYDVARGMQAFVIQAAALGCQVRFILYNTNKPRILSDFASRGTSGENWTASSTEPGDFSPNNLNNDITEFYWRSATGVRSGIILTCDAEQAVAADTLALLDHNLTRSATVIFQGSNVSDFSTITYNVTLEAMTRNTFWVAPELPQDSLRYWRLLISDNTNPDDYVKIGTVVFGQATIFQGEAAEQHVKVKRTHFRQEVETEGHTAVTQDLALKKAITINFPDMDAQHAGNYDALVELFEYARTSLKCLWMVDPRPLYIEKFTVFGKITDLPQEDHNVITSDEFRVSLSVDIDEAK